MDDDGGMFMEELPAATGNIELHVFDNLEQLPADSTCQTSPATSMAELLVLEIFPSDPLVDPDSGVLPIFSSWLTTPAPPPEVNPDPLRTISGEENEKFHKRQHAEDNGSASREKGADVSGEKDRPRKKTRAAKAHNEAEKKRREKMKRKMKELRELLPVSSKLDTASTLDEAIKQLKSLQFQIHTLVMGWWACGAPVAAPLFYHQWQRHLHHMESMAVRINEWMQHPEADTAVSCPPPPQSHFV